MFLTLTLLGPCIKEIESATSRETFPHQFDDKPEFI